MVPPRVLLLCAALLCAAATAGADAPARADAPAGADRPHLSDNPDVSRARALVEAGDHGAALSILRPLAVVATARGADRRDHADRTDILFLVGLAALRLSRHPGTAETDRAALLDEAIAALHAILVERPGLVRVRLELARAFFLKGEDGLARDHFERVLAGSPPPAMAANIRGFLEAIRARRRWDGWFGATLAPDSNLNAASDTGVIHIHGLPFRRDEDAGVRSGVGVVLWGGGEYQHPLGPRLQLRAGADLVRREYAGRDFDRTFLSVHAGPSRRVGRAADISVLGSARRRWAGGHPDSHELGARLETSHRLTRQLAGFMRASWHRRDHDRDRYLDGPYHTFSLGGRWQATPTIRVDSTVGHAWERTRSPVWRNSGRWVRLGAQVALPRGVTVGIGGKLLWTRYEGDWAPFTPDGSSRRDRSRVLEASVLNRAFTVYGFSPRLLLVNEVRESNAQLYDYRRNRAELQFKRQF